MFLHRRIRFQPVCCSLFLVVLAGLTFSSPGVSQDGQGNAILTMGGDCSPGAGLDFQVRGCASERARAYLISDTDPGPFVHRLGTFGVGFSPNRVVRKGRIGPDGSVRFWLDDPIDESLVGQNLYWQAAFFDPEAPNGLAITNTICLPVCSPDESYSCRTAVGKLDAIMVVGPESSFPVQGHLEISSGQDELANLPFSFDLPGPSGPFQSGDGFLTILRITTLDPCSNGNGRSRLGVQFRLDGSKLTEQTLPDSISISVTIGNNVTAKTLNTSCDSPLGVGLTETRPLVITCIEDCPLLDFETGDDFSTELVNGREINSPVEFGNIVDITSSSSFGAAIFDSNVGGANDPGRDPDLLVNLDNILIVQENGTQTSSGIFDFPDDEASGGSILFDFVRPVMPLRITLIDIDETNQGVVLVLTDSSGNTRSYNVPSDWTTDIEGDGPPGFAALSLSTMDPQQGHGSQATATEDGPFDLRDVMSLNVTFMGSGALDNLQICPTVR